MAIGDCYRLTVTMQGLGSTYLNIWALYQKSTSVLLSDFTTIANAIRELARPSQSGALTYRSWRAVQVRGGSVTPVQAECRREGGVVFEANFSGTNTGGGAATETLPPQCSLVVTLASNLFGRRHRGRIYFPAFNENLQADGIWDATLITTMNGRLASFLALYGAAGSDPTWTVGVWSERTATGCEVRGDPPRLVNIDTPNLANAFTPLSTMTPRSTVFTQRRRTAGHGQ